MMRIISQDEKIDVPYEIIGLNSSIYENTILSYVHDDWVKMAEFDSGADALREMRRIRRAYEAGAKYYIIGTGDHDGPMEV